MALVHSADNELDNELDDELDPLVLLATRAPACLPHRTDAAALGTYIYPTNLPVRDYQYNIVQRAFFHNTLVVLPTGLGKTFIASTVMLNFLRWFPGSKLVFMAPTKPLVAQQIKACCGTTGLVPLQMAVLLDLTRRNRAQIWAEKSVFFTTPQVVENDLKLGTVDPRHISLVVIDEAHRARGNYAYRNVVAFMNRFSTHYRILAMTATPASTVEGVQEIIDNLHISRAEVRTERSIDIFKYLKHKTVERIHAAPSEDVSHAVRCICTAIAPILKQANQRGVYDVTDPALINAFTAMDALRRLVANKAINEGAKWAGHSLLQVLGVAGQCLRRLNIYGIRSFYSYFREKHVEATRKAARLKNQTSAAKFFQHPEIALLMEFCLLRVADPGYLGHEKLEFTVAEVRRFFASTANADSRVIVFSEFRESALDIVRALEHLGHGLRPHIFIGQSKDSRAEDGPKTKAERKIAREKAAENGRASSELAQLTGMSQKLQKETIRKFKLGDYNVLVATSIGEEGLDIGEVDLIVCYDSTSSPIKNVQRMGRTGRNRAGKVVLLFSGNEEAKFDRAMGGYEYIQQHIMNGNLIQLHNQNRLIPLEFTPTAVERFIEIPEENTAIREEVDDDEIIKIATKYMSRTQASKLKALAKTRKKLAGPEKVQKKFFMPDNVATGFQPVSLMVRGSAEFGETSDIPPAKRSKVDHAQTLMPDVLIEQSVDDKREPDILDSFLDSDESQSDIDKIVSVLGPLPKAPNLDCSFAEAKKPETQKSVEKSVLAFESPESINSTPAKILRQPQLDTLFSLASSSRLSSPLLGVRKRSPSVIDQLKAQKYKTASHPSAHNSTTRDACIPKEATKNRSPEPKGLFQNEPLPNAHIQHVPIKNESTQLLTSTKGMSDDDDFSDDDEILALALRTQSSDWATKKPASQIDVEVSKSRHAIKTHENLDMTVNCVQLAVRCQKREEDLLFLQPPPVEMARVDPETVHICADTDGLLTTSDWDELYMNYYAPVEEFGLEHCVIPHPSAINSEARYSGTRSKSYSRLLKSIDRMSDSDAVALIEQYELLGRLPISHSREVIDSD